jgi:phage/plasmid-associated DNA primase
MMIAQNQFFYRSSEQSRKPTNMNILAPNNTSVKTDDQLLADAEHSIEDDAAELMRAIAEDPQPTEQPPQDYISPMRQAIDTLDPKKLYACVDGLAQLKRLNRISYSLTKQEIKEKFGKLVNWKDFNSALADAERRQTLAEDGGKPDVADIAHQWVMRFKDTWAYDAGAGCWRMWNDEFWEEVQDKASVLDQYCVAALQEAKIAVNSSNVLNTFQRIAQSHCSRQFVPAPHKINFANGTLDTRTGQLTRFDKEDNLTYCLPYFYNPQRMHPRITAFLLSIIQEKSDDEYVPNHFGVQAIMAHIGLALLGDIALHKVITALGAPGSGKSTLLDLINAVFGLLPGSYVPHDVFSRELEGKRSRYIHNKRRVACLDEVPADALQDEETFKSMAAHKGVSMRGLHRDEQIDNQWKPKIFMVANDDPHYKDISGAIKRRMIVVRTPIQRYDEPMDGQPGQNALLLDSFLPELEGFVVTCIRYAMEVRQRGYYPQSAAMKRDLDAIATLGNPLKSCIEDKFFVGEGVSEKSAMLHTVYVDYCEGMGKNIKALARNNFSAALVGMNIGIRIGRDKEGDRCLFGVRLRFDDDPKLTGDDDSSKYHDSLASEVDDPAMDAILDAGVDAVDADLTQIKGLRQDTESTPQASSQEPLTQLTQKSDNLAFFQTHIHSPDEREYVFPIEKEFGKSASTASTNGIKPHDKPVYGVDAAQNKSVTCVKSASKMCTQGLCSKKAVAWFIDEAYCQGHILSYEKAKKQDRR